MPKFTYSAAKGIEQSSGSGFFVNGAPMVENQQTLTVAGSGGAGGTDFDQITAYGASNVVIPANTGNATAVLAVGSYVGQMKYIFCSSRSATGSPQLAITVTSGASGNTTVTLDAANEACALVWTGAAWLKVYDVGSTCS